MRNNLVVCRIVLLVAICFLVGCAAGPNELSSGGLYRCTKEIEHPGAAMNRREFAQSLGLSILGLGFSALDPPPKLRAPFPSQRRNNGLRNISKAWKNCSCPRLAVNLCEHKRHYHRNGDDPHQSRRN